MQLPSKRYYLYDAAEEIDKCWYKDLVDDVSSNVQRPFSSSSRKPRDSTDRSLIFIQFKPIPKSELPE